MTPVPAQSGQRDEDLLGEGDHAGPPGVAQAGVTQGAGGFEQLVEGLTAGSEQRDGLVGVEHTTFGGTPQRPAQARRGRWEVDLFSHM
jgi:hypothetical protein